MSKPTCVCISSCALHKCSVIICREVPFLSGCGEHLQLCTTISHERLLRGFSGEVKLAKWGPTVLVSGHRAPRAPRHWEKKNPPALSLLGFYSDSDLAAARTQNKTQGAGCICRKWSRLQQWKLGEKQLWGWLGENLAPAFIFAGCFWNVLVG